MAALLSPALKSAREKARQIKCLNNLKQIGVAFFLYSQENDDYSVPFYYDYMTTLGWSVPTRPYYKNTEMIKCPSARLITGLCSRPEEYSTSWNTTPPAAYDLNLNGWAAGPPIPPCNVISGTYATDAVKLGRISRPAETAWLWDGQYGSWTISGGGSNIFASLAQSARHGGLINILFCDGHCEVVGMNRNMPDEQFRIDE